MHDPVLTPKGEEQSRALRATFPHHERIELVVSSPLRRALYTALLAFEPEMQRGLRVVALPEVQETSDVPCDTGHAVEALREEFGGEKGGGKVDLGLVGEGWNIKKGKWAPSADAVEARAKEARRWLKARSEKEIVLVTHGGFLHYFTEDWTGSDKLPGTGWENTEFRSYEFVDVADGAEDMASLRETDESRRRRRGTEKPLTQTEQMELRETTLKNWNGEG